jgi:putative acyl-CoA dehydrogenase
LGKEHDGVKTIIEMVNGTRIDSAIGSAALIRQGLIQVIQFCCNKKVL